MNIPNHAKRVFKGTIFDVYQWDQKLFDGSTAIFEALKRPGTVQIIPSIGNKILLPYEEQPHYPARWGFFGGRLEENEEPLNCAKRELLEETGMESDDWELYKTYKQPGKLDWQVYLYIARNVKKVQKPHLEPGEKIQTHEIDFQTFLTKLLTEDFRAEIIAFDLHRLTHNPKQLTRFKKLLFP